MHKIRLTTLFLELGEMVLMQMNDCQYVQGGNRDTREAKKQHNLLKHYF